MKVLQINAVYHYGSTGRITEELHDALRAQGIDSYVACSQIFGDGKDVYRIGSDIDVKIHGLLSRLSGEQGHFSKRNTKKLLEYMDSIQPDIVHLGNLHANFIHFPTLLSYLAKKNIATVVTLHDCWFFTGKCCYFSSVDCNKWEKGCHDCPLLKTDNVSWFFDKTPTLWEEKRNLFHAVARLGVIGVSDWITEMARKSEIFQNAKMVERIYNWIDTSVFRPAKDGRLLEKYGLADKFVILGVASGWGERKGIFDFIRLSELLPENMRIVLIGKKDPGLSLPDQMIHIGATEDIQELVRWYSSADVFVTLSKEETFGKVSAEALSCGTPVVCYDTTANPELVGQNCGYAVEKGNVAAIADAVCRVREKTKAFYTESCVSFARGHFEKEELIQEYIHFYQRLAQ